MTTRTTRRLERRVDAAVSVPGSKSIANRALVCAALAEGTSEVANVPDGDDTTSLLMALGALGVDVAADGDRVGIAGHGTDFPAADLHAGLAGTTSRFLTAVAALGRRPITIDGHAPLRARPFGPLHDALTQLGVEVVPGERPGHLPTTIVGPPAGGQVTVRGDVSSQYISALMLIAPYLPRGLRIELTSSLVSVPYVRLTAEVMAVFGVGGVDITDAVITVPPGTYRPVRFSTEPDASSASYPLAVAAVRGGRVTVLGLGTSSLQGDARFADLLGRMGCGISRTGDATTVESGSRLHGIDVDMADISDLVPTMAVVAACAETPTRIRGVGFIRAKESDRLGDLARELRHLGVDVAESDDGLDVRPSSGARHAGRVGTHHDHRLAMAFGVLGTTLDRIEIDDPDVVSKSWPGFWRMLDGLRR